MSRGNRKTKGRIDDNSVGTETMERQTKRA